MNTILAVLFVVNLVALIGFGVYSIDHRYTKEYGWEHRSTIHFGNLTGSGLLIEYVRANAQMFPMSGLPESAGAPIIGESGGRPVYIGTSDAGYDGGGGALGWKRIENPDGGYTMKPITAVEVANPPTP